jgi:hypothetical protein
MRKPGISGRQVQYLKKAVREQGDGAVIHGNPGRHPAGVTAEAVRASRPEKKRAIPQGFLSRIFGNRLRNASGYKPAIPACPVFLEPVQNPPFSLFSCFPPFFPFFSAKLKQNGKSTPYRGYLNIMEDNDYATKP